jgi:hypothetical protein
MTPSVYQWLDQLPLLPNGKVDRGKLPAITAGRPELEQRYEAPGTETEAALVQAWQLVLGLDRIGIHDNFFDLGGDSLTAVQLHGRLRELLKRELFIVDIFTHPTIASFAKYLNQDSSEQVDRQEVHDRATARRESVRLRAEARSKSKGTQ